MKGCRWCHKERLDHETLHATPATAREDLVASNASLQAAPPVTSGWTYVMQHPP